MARILKIIPIERSSLRRLPGVMDAVARRLRAGQTVVVFPEGTTWCGVSGDDAGDAGHAGHAGPGVRSSIRRCSRPRSMPVGPVQPLRLTYHHADGTVSTAPAFVGDDTLLRSICRLLIGRRTLACVQVESLQLPGADRRALASRCHSAVEVGSPRQPGHGPCWWPERLLAPPAGIAGARMVYLDHAATTPMHPAALEAMTAALGHRRQRLLAANQAAGRRGAIEESRELIADETRRASIGGDLHRGRHRERQPGREGHLLGPPRRRGRAIAASSPPRWNTTPCWTRSTGSSNTKAPQVTWPPTASDGSVRRPR